MLQVIQAICPKCRNLLRIPADWLGRTMRCKHCQEVFEARSKSPAALVSAPAVPATAPTPLRPAASPPAARSRNADPFAFDDEPEPAMPLSRRRGSRRAGGWWKGLVLAGCVAAVTGGVFIFAGPQLSALFRSDSDSKQAALTGDNSEPATNGGDPTGKTPNIPEKTQEEPRPRPKAKKTPSNPKNIVRSAFPRRALLINVNNYLYLNSLHYGSPQSKYYPGSSTAAIADRMTRRPLNIPATQVIELSDGGHDPRPTIKAVIENTIGDFLDTSRDQDRIIILFAGHAVDIDKDAYLVPLEGDTNDPKTLIPLKWVYDRMAKCPAWQKVLILDVCRFPPARGLEMPVPGSGEMGPVLDAMLQKPPAGVQVWSSCIKDQKSYEFEGGSAFMQSLCDAMKEGLGGIQEQESALPMDALLGKVKTKMKELLDPEKLVQTPRLTGKNPAAVGPFDASEPLPDRLTIRLPQGPRGNFASEALVKNILGEIRQIPQVRAMRRGAENLLKMNYLPPFPKALEAYKSDSPTFDTLYKMKEDGLAKFDDKYPLRVAVVEAIHALSDNSRFVMKESLTSPGGPITAAIKNAFLKDQEQPGMAILSLETALKKLNDLGKKKRDREFSKRWLAQYEYTMARLQARLVYTYEYDYCLAGVRTDRLPELNPAIHNGWRVASTEKVNSTKEPKVKDYVKNVGKLWKKVMKDYPGTPWAVMARRESVTALGLDWRPSRE
jgi:hypothetical protein